MKKLLTRRQLEVYKAIKQLSIVERKIPSFRKIAKKIGVKSPNSVKKHLDVLLEKGYMSKDKGRYSLVDTDSNYAEIPIVGYANAGQPLIDADEDYLGSIKIKDLNTDTKELFGVIVQGDSMNKCKIKGKILDDKTYAIIEKSKNYNDRDIVLAIIDESATIKMVRVFSDYIVLSPISNNSYHREIYVKDTDNFFINGKVIDVYPMLIG